MRINNIFMITCLCLIISSCKSIQPSVDKTIADNSSKQDESSKIEGFLLEESFDIISNYSSIQIFEILKTPIKEEPGEYSNKLVFQKKLSHNESQRLIKNILSDSNYLWSSYKDQPDFSPNKQILIKDDLNQINILFDDSMGYVSFINLNGSSTIKVKEPLRSILKNI